MSINDSADVYDRLKHALMVTPNGVDRAGTEKGYHLKALIKDTSQTYPDMYIYAVCGGTGQVRYFSQWTIDGMYAESKIIGMYHAGVYIPSQFLTHDIKDIDKYIKTTGQGV